MLGARSNAGRFMEAQNLFNWLAAKTPTVFATQAVIATRLTPDFRFQISDSRLAAWRALPSTQFSNLNLKSQS